jgi:hypothetical protein
MDTPSSSTLTTTVFSQCRLRMVWSRPLQADSGGSVLHHFSSFSCCTVSSLLTDPHCCGTHNYPDTGGETEDWYVEEHELANSYLWVETLPPRMRSDTRYRQSWRAHCVGALWSIQDCTLSASLMVDRTVTQVRTIAACRLAKRKGKDYGQPLTQSARVQ